MGFSPPALLLWCVGSLGVQAYTTCASTVFTTLISYTLLQKSPPSLLFGTIAESCTHFSFCASGAEGTEGLVPSVVGR